MRLFRDLFVPTPERVTRGICVVLFSRVRDQVESYVTHTDMSPHSHHYCCIAAAVTAERGETDGGEGRWGRGAERGRYGQGEKEAYHTCAHAHLCLVLLQT